MPDPGDPKGISSNTPKHARLPVFSTSDITAIRECIIFYLNKNDFQLEANTSAGFTPTQDNVAKRDRLLKLMHRLGRIDNV